VALLPASQILALCALWLALSQPVWSCEHLAKSAQVVLAIDVSKSMAAEDFQPNRLIAAKETALEFIKSLPVDVELSLILFDGQARLGVPMSKKRKSVEAVLQKLNLKSLGKGTAIGEAILLADKAIAKGQHKKGDRHLILLTDGENNAGIDPFEAIGQVNNWKIYTIGIGSPAGGVVSGGLVTNVDRDLLRQIAQSTGGEYFEAWQGSKQLKNIYKSLSQNYHQETVEMNLSSVFVLIGLCLCAFCFTLRWTKLRGL
jgi:Ca-activated chloride channel family protein